MSAYLTLLVLAWSKIKFHSSSSFRKQFVHLCILQVQSNLLGQFGCVSISLTPLDKWVDVFALRIFGHEAIFQPVFSFYRGPTTSLPPTAQALPLISILVLCLVWHFHKLESDHSYLGKRNRVCATHSNCMHNCLNGNVLLVATWVREAIVFLSLNISNEVLQSNFFLVDLFHHHYIWELPLLWGQH